MRAPVAVQVSPYAWHWVHPASPLTQICAVVDPATPGAVVNALVTRFGSAPQFSLLVLHDPDALHSEWHTTYVAQANGAPRRTAIIERILDALPRPCHLVLCGQSAVGLDWLGSVRGHRCWIAPLHPVTDTARQTAVATEAVRAALSAMLADRWGDSL